MYVGRRTHEALLTYRTFVRPRHAKNVTVTSFFLSQEGRTLTLGAIQQMMRDLGQAAGVPRLHPHLLRHTSATQYLVNGGCHQPAAQAGARRAGDDQPLRTFCLGGAGRDPGAGGAHGQAGDQADEGAEEEVGRGRVSALPSRLPGLYKKAFLLPKPAVHGTNVGSPTRRPVSRSGQVPAHQAPSPRPATKAVPLCRRPLPSNTPLDLLAFRGMLR